MTTAVEIHGPRGAPPARTVVRSTCFTEGASYGAATPAEILLPHVVIGLVVALAVTFDHDLLQAGFDLGTPVLDAASIGWTSNTLLKDNDEHNDYLGTELVSVLSGSSVQMWHPDTVLRWFDRLGWESVSNTVPLIPNNDPDGGSCIGGEDTTLTEHSVENVPFDYAVPVLTGWQLEYPCNNHHVEKIGVWIKGFHYDAGKKTLCYTIESTLADDAVHTGEAQYAVSILGLNRAGLLPNQPAITGSTGPSTLLAATALQLP